MKGSAPGRAGKKAKARGKKKRDGEEIWIDSSGFAQE